MAARPYWKGQLRLALVSIPVELYSAQKSGPTIAFHQIHEPSGKRIRYEKVVPGIGPVSAEQIARGFETSKGEYVLLDEKEIEAVKLESKKTLELTRFVETDAIDRIYYDRPYYLVPADELAQEAYIVVRDAMRASRKVGIGQLALRGREHVVAVRPCGRGMILETLHYAEEVNRAASYFRDIADARPDKELLELATSLIDKKTGTFDAADYHDHYVDAIRELIELKRRGKTVKAEPDERPSGTNVVDLMAALKRSVEGGREAAPKPAKAATSAKAKPAVSPRRKTAA